MSKSKPRKRFNPFEPKWRYTDLIRHLGGIPTLSRSLQARGYTPPGRETIKGWKGRNSIPPAWLPAVLAVAIDQQVIKGPEDLLEPGSK